MSNKFFSRFGLLATGLVFCIVAYLLNSHVPLSLLFSSLGGVFILVGLLVASRSSMLGFGKNLQIFNGIGTTLYGKSNFDQKDKSYVATKWFVFIWLPVFPLASYRVIKMESKSVPFGRKIDYQMVGVPINRAQVTKTYLLTYAVIACLVFCVYLYFR